MIQSKRLQLILTIFLLLGSPSPSYAGEFTLNDNTTINGDFKNNIIKIKSSFGDIDLQTDNIAFIEGDSIHFLDGNITKGKISTEKFTVITTDGQEISFPVKNMLRYKIFMLQAHDKSMDPGAEWKYQFCLLFKDDPTAQTQPIDVEDGPLNGIGGQNNRTAKANVEVSKLNKDFQKLVQLAGYKETDEITVQGTTSPYFICFKNIAFNNIDRPQYEKIINLLGKNTPLGKIMTKAMGDIIDPMAAILKMDFTLQGDGILSIITKVSNLKPDIRNIINNPNPNYKILIKLNIEKNEFLNAMILAKE